MLIDALFGYRRILFLSICFMLGIMPSGKVVAQNAEETDISMSIGDEGLMLSFHFPSLLSDEFEKMLESGFSVFLQWRFTVTDADKNKTLAEHKVTARIRYLLWEEKYLVEWQGKNVKRKIYENLDDVKQDCVTFKDLLLASRRKIENVARISLSILVLLNPDSEEDLRNVREWMVKPQGGQSYASSGFVKMVVRWFASAQTELGKESLKFTTEPIELDKLKGNAP